MGKWTLPACATLLSVLFVVVLQVSSGDVTALSDGAQLGAAMLASAGCAVGSRRSVGQGRRAWAWLAAGTGCWAAGQAVWTFYEVALGEEVPFPSLADVGFLAFPLVAGVGLVLWPGRHRHQAITRGRDVMDGAIIAVSFLVLSWVTVMAPLVSANDVSGFTLALSLAYPAGDVILATLVLILLSRSESERVPLILLAVGLGGFALADSLFSYLTSAGTYSSANLVSSSGWVAGFLFVGAAGTTVSRWSRTSVDDLPPEDRSSWVSMALPYLPLLGAGVALCLDLLATDSSDLTDLLLGVSLVVMVLVRQFLAMVDNQRLMKALGDAGAKLEHIATHDALTGLPNRTLFTKRLDRALMQSPSNVSVMFCDLDNFKPVNDELGHAAGDRLLQLVAERLLSCVRVTDTVARLGGDEFAIVLVDCPEPYAIAERVVACIGEEATVHGREIHPSISVGVACHGGEPRPIAAPIRRNNDRRTRDRRGRPRTRDGARVAAAAAVVAADSAAERTAMAGRLLRVADTAMYAAKTAGKGRVAVLESDAALATVIA